jgi:serine/threonine protein kinase/predicted Zn-dependent protease
MTPGGDKPALACLDDFVTAFEEAWARQGGPDLEDFLPPRGHPLYRAVVRELVRIDLERRWTTGQPRALSAYVATFPELFQHPADLREVAFEEYRLRHQAGERPTTEEYRRTYHVDTAGWPSFVREPPVSDNPGSRQAFPLVPAGGDPPWRGAEEEDSDLLLLAEVGRADPATASLLARALAALPEVASSFLDFRLVAELGRGAFGRVYLAQQGGLANRLVALKISVRQANEPQALARLQHTNIMPIYSVHRAGLFQAVCMPFLGAATLADLVRAWQARPALPTTGRELVETLRHLQAWVWSTALACNGRPGLPPGAAIPLRLLEPLTYVQAILWLGTRLADGLAHAHERGILHRDLKPANVLLTDDGTPMLLDFNLSTDAGEGTASAAWIGGTLPYMAPEHLEAFLGGTGNVDARSDLYALGVILYELLTGRLPFAVGQGLPEEVLPRMIAERRRSPPRLRCFNGEVSPAVESIVRRLLEPEPARRYQTAEEVREDLERQLEHRPLKYARDRSPAERLHKWVRRHPRLASPVAAVALVLVGIVGLAAWASWRAYRDERGRAVRQEEEIVALRRRARQEQEAFRAAMKLLKGRDGEILLVQVAFDAGPLAQHQPKKDLALCRQALARYRVLDDPAWQKHSGLRYLHPSEQERVRQDVAELLYLLARDELLRVGGAAGAIESVETLVLALPAGRPAFAPFDAVRGAFEARVRAARDLNERAARCFRKGRVPRALLLQRQDVEGLLGNKAKARHLAAQARAVRPRSARDFYLSACEYGQRGDFRMALALGEEARTLQPRDFGVWFLLGVCHARLGKPDEAVRCLDTCLALRPDWPLALFNRGVAHLACRKWRAALADLNAVVEARPGVAVVFTRRAQARQGLKHYPEAIRDVTEALSLNPSAELHAYRARLRKLAGDKAGAAKDRKAVLTVPPGSALGWVERARQRRAADPDRALADYDRALECDPQDATALEERARLLSDDLQRDDEAVQQLDRAVDRYPSAAGVRMARALVLAHLGRRRAAHQDAEECLLNDHIPAMQYRAACVYAMTSRWVPGDRKRALVLLKAAVRRGHGLGIEEDPRLALLHGNRQFQLLAAWDAWPGGDS